jgi:lipoyl(octanoyl) transferase
LDDFRDRFVWLANDPVLPPFQAASCNRDRLKREDRMKFEKLRLIDDVIPKAASENMAVDEALFLTAETPVLRIYRWLSPSVSFGYFTPWNEVIRSFPGRDLVRRWTGGGIVEHGNDLTYSLACPSGLEIPKTLEFYQFIHAAVATVLRDAGYSVEFAQSAETVDSNACFEKTVRYDLKSGGAKIAGAAVRRNRKGLLLQGSIQRLQIPAGFGEMFGRALCDRPESHPLPEPILLYAKRIAREKYGAAEWNRKR